MTRLSPSKRAESGQATVMIVGFFVVIGLLMVVVVNASAAFLQRQRLNNVADGAALAAAQGLRAEAVYQDGVSDSSDAALDPALAAQLVGKYLARRDDAGRLNWQVAAQDTKITVRLRKPLDMPLVPPGWMGSSVITAEATALLRLD